MRKNIYIRKNNAKRDILFFNSVINRKIDINKGCSEGHERGKKEKERKGKTAQWKAPEVSSSPRHSRPIP